MALSEEASPSPKVIRCPLSSEKGSRLVRAREKGVELGEEHVRGHSLGETGKSFKRHR